MAENKVYELSDRWVLWFHEADNNDWSLESYQRLAVLETLEDYHAMVNTIDNITAGMFFIMKDGINPTWEDKRHGGFWSFKIMKDKSSEIWNSLGACLVGESLTTKQEQMRFINGISFSPKLNKAIVKIWSTESRKKPILSKNIRFLSIKDALWKKA